MKEYRTTEIHAELPGATTDPHPRVHWVQPSRPGGIAMLVFAGGGYGGLSAHEGIGMAQHFAGKNINCFVVEYRLGSQGFRHPAMLEDALAAMYTIRSRAGDFGIDPNRLGVIGSSAGGHLAAHVSVAYDRLKTDVSLRPDFTVLCYPVISATHLSSHTGSVKNLLGENPSQEQLDEISCEKHVTEQTPPCFLWHTAEDDVVPPVNSMLFAEQLQNHGIPHELHIYARGSHGLGLGGNFTWEQDCLRWIHEQIQ